MDRSFSEYGYFCDDTLFAVNRFLTDDAITKGPYPSIHPYTHTIDEATWKSLGLGERPDVPRFTTLYVPDPDAVALARELLDIEYNTQHDTFWLNGWKSIRLTYAKTYAGKLEEALSDEVQVKILAAVADLFVAGFEGKSFSEIIIGILDPEPGISDIIDETIGEAARRAAQEAYQQYNAINESPLLYVANVSGSYRDNMALDAFKAIDRVNESNHPQSVKDEAIAYITNIIRLCYDKNAREAYLKTVLDSVK